MKLRDYALTYLPPWLLDSYGTAWARATGDVKDSLVALLKERVAARMPVRPGASEVAPYAPTGALEALGRDRLMPRAIGEPDAGYASRLADAWTIHADGGTPRGALRALRAAGYPEAMLVIRSQRLYKLDADGELVVEMLPAGSWCFSPEPQSFWSRYAVLFHWENLPPAWPQVLTEFVVGPVSQSNPDANAQPPTLALLDNPPADCLVRVEFLAVTTTTQTDDITLRYRFSPTDTWRTISFNNASPTQPLYDATGDGPFFNVTMTSDSNGGLGDGYVVGEYYDWPVTHTSQFVTVPGEESREMNLVRALTKEWSNAAAVFMGITVVVSGRCWGYRARTWGEAASSGDTWGVTTSVLNYHP